MPWISAAAAREELKESARKHLLDQRSGTAPRTAKYSTITNAFVSGDAEAIKLAGEHAVAMLPVMEQRLKLDDATNTANYLNLVAAASVTGSDIRPRLERLLAAKADKDPTTLLLRWIADAVLQGGAPKAAPRLGKSAGWMAKITQATPADALDLVLAPDHPDWVEMQAFVLPLALLLSTKTGTPMATYAHDGGHPERRGDVLYERAAPRPSVRVAVNETDPATWPGFDAVERKENKLLVYHYLDQSWESPIAFQSDVDAVPFLRHVPLSWKLVEKSVAPEVWKGIQADLDAARVVHVLAHDPVKAPVAENAIENASRAYGIELTAADYRSI